MIPSYATLLSQAARLSQTGPIEAAIAAHRTLLDAYPESPDVWYNLALLERRARRPVASLSALSEALARGISGPEEVWLQQGVVLSDDLGQADAARVVLTHALTIAPRYVPALLNMGNLEEDVGDRVAAEACYRRALAEAPGEPLVLARLAGVATVTGPGDPLLEQLRDVLGRVQGDPLAEADLGFALGAALDQIGEFDAAFDSYVSANHASRRFAAVQGLRYDRGKQERWVDRLIAASPPPVSVGRSDGSSLNSPLFVCGMMRSGSTLVERMLARHDALVAGGEIDSIPTIAARMTAYPEGVTGLSGEQRRGLADRYRAETLHRRSDGRRLIDKRPDNITHIALIHALFPDARIIRTVRAPLDNLVSAFFLHADPTLPWATDLGDIAHYLWQERRLATHAKELLGPALHEVHYEMLVGNPRGEMTALLDFCGLAWDENVLDPTGGRGAVRTASVWQVREPIHQRSRERWRHYAHRLGDLCVALEGMA